MRCKAAASGATRTPSQFSVARRPRAHLGRVHLRYSNWPTIPQLYIDGEFLGGCDIMIEMYQSGELQQEVEKAAAS